MTKKETIQVLQSIEDRAVDFPYMTACDWVAIAAAKRYLKNSLEAKEVNLNKELSYKDYNSFFTKYPDLSDDWGFDECWVFARYFFELGLKAKGE